MIGNDAAAVQVLPLLSVAPEKEATEAPLTRPNVTSATRSADRSPRKTQRRRRAVGFDVSMEAAWCAWPASARSMRLAVDIA